MREFRGTWVMCRTIGTGAGACAGAGAGVGGRVVSLYAYFFLSGVVCRSERRCG